MAAIILFINSFIFLFIRDETKLVEPLEELVALGEVPGVDGVVMTAVLDIEYLWLQCSCKPNVMELVPITEAQPSIAAFWPQNYNFFGK